MRTRLFKMYLIMLISINILFINYIYYVVCIYMHQLQLNNNTIVDISEFALFRGHPASLLD
jgi:hypothetical protein